MFSCWSTLLTDSIHLRVARLKLFAAIWTGAQLEESTALESAPESTRHSPMAFRRVSSIACCSMARFWARFVFGENRFFLHIFLLVPSMSNDVGALAREAIFWIAMWKGVSSLKFLQSIADRFYLRRSSTISGFECSIDTCRALAWLPNPSVWLKPA